MKKAGLLIAGFVLVAWTLSPDKADITSSEESFGQFSIPKVEYR